MELLMRLEMLKANYRMREIMTTEKKTGTYEWAPARDNCILGCSNDCLYCYAKANAVRFKRETPDTWKIEHQNRNAKAKKHKGRVMFPTSHDLHIEHVHWWGPHLHQLLELGNDVLIVTKGECAAVRYICDSFSAFSNQIEFRFTIGTSDEGAVKYWEPGAPTIWQRRLSLSYAVKNGFQTSVSMEPLLMENPTIFIDRCLYAFVTGEIWIGMMNHYALNPKIPEEKRQILIQSKENMQRVYEATKDNPKVRYKDTLRELLGLNPE
jgi:DNA repair photolyase